MYLEIVTKSHIGMVTIKDLERFWCLFGFLGIKTKYSRSLVLSKILSIVPSHLNIKNTTDSCTGIRRNWQLNMRGFGGKQDSYRKCCARRSFSGTELVRLESSGEGKGKAGLELCYNCCCLALLTKSNQAMRFKGR